MLHLYGNNVFVYNNIYMQKIQILYMQLCNADIKTVKIVFLETYPRKTVHTNTKSVFYLHCILLNHVGCCELILRIKIHIVFIS